MKTDFLSKWRPREIEGLLFSMARYTRFVLFSKFFLVVFAGGLILLLVAIPLINSGDQGMRIVFSSAKNGEVLTPQMIKPRYQGTDSRNQPFTITADLATQLPDGRVEMTALNADVMMQSGAWMALSANRGFYRMDQKTLAMSGEVRLFYDQGYEFRSEEAMIDMERKTAQGDKPVTGQGPMGVLKAGGFRVHDGGARMEFTKPVHLTLYPKAK